MSQLLYIQFSWQQLRAWCSSRLTRRLFATLILMLMLWIVLNPAFVSAYAGLGGYISEKLLGAAGNAGSLYLGSSTNGPVVLGSGPRITTTQLTSADIALGPGTATLRGDLASLNGMPQAGVYFTWGYNASLTNTTPTITVTTTGEKTATVSFDTKQELYYQFIAGSDGTSLGGVRSISSARATSFSFLGNTLIILIAAAIFILIIAKTGDPLAALVGTVIGLIAVYVVKAILGI